MSLNRRERTKNGCPHDHPPVRVLRPDMGPNWVQDTYPDCPQGCPPQLPFIPGKEPAERDVAWSPAPVALVVAPYRMATREDRRSTSFAVEALLKAGWAPVFYPWVLQNHLDDEVPEQRAAALACSEAFVHALANSEAPVACFVVGARRTEGMRLDLERWGERGPVYAAPGPSYDLPALVELGDELRRAR